MAAGGRAQRGPRGPDVGVGPTGRRSRRPGLPHRALPARRPGDLERLLVRRPLHAQLQRPVPARGGAARPAGGGDAVGGRLLLPLRPPRPRPLGDGGALGDALVRGRRRHPARRRPADLRPRRGASGWRRCARCRWGGRRWRSSPPRPARWRARSRAPSSPASSSPGPGNGASASTAPRSPPPRSRFVLTVAPNLAFPEPGRFPFATSSFISIPLWCGAALFLTWRLDGEARLRRVVLGYAVAATAVFLAPNALGGNAVRLGALFGGPLLAAVLLSHRPLPVGAPAARPPRSARGLRRPARRPLGAALVLHRGPRHHLGGQPLLAVHRQRHPGRPRGRRPLDLGLLLPARRPLADGPRRPRHPDRGAADREPLGVGLPGAEVRARPRLAAPARHRPRRPLLRGRRPHPAQLRPLAARQRDLLRRPARRARSTTPRSRRRS